MFVLLLLACLPSCAVEPEDIGLEVTVDSSMNATARVRITNVNFEEFDLGADLDKITIYYAYTDSKKEELSQNQNYKLNGTLNSFPDMIGDGCASCEISDEEVAAFRKSGKNYWEKQINFQLPAQARSRSVDYLVRLDGKDIFHSIGDSYSSQGGTTSSGVFTFTATARNMYYTVTIPASVSLGQTANVSVDECGALGFDKCVCVKIQGDSDGKFTLSLADDKLEYGISAKYPNDNKSYALTNNALFVYANEENTNTDKTAALTFNSPTAAAAAEIKYAGTYWGTVTFNVSIEDNPAITIDQPSLFLFLKETQKLTVKDRTIRSIGNVTWSSSNPAVAAVSSDGTVTGKAKGVATITATASSGRTAVCMVTVGTATNITNLHGAYQAKDGETLTGKANADAHITIADGASVTLKSCDITAIANDVNHSWAGITLEGNGTLLLEGVNKVKGGCEDYPGVYVPEGKTLTIKGHGSLEASSNGYAAGIGSGMRLKCGNITIADGIVTANGGEGSAGIGSAETSSTCGKITITGGFVTANGGDNGAGIGCGSGYSYCESITITGGTVTAKGGDSAAGIGSGYWESGCGDITIKKTVIKVEATRGSDSPNAIGAGYLGACGTISIEQGANVVQN